MVRQATVSDARVRRPSFLAALLLLTTFSATLAASPQPSPSSSDHAAVPTRIVIRDLGIDLPVVSSDTDVAGNPEDYPLCDVAEYWTRYGLPGIPGTTWIYAHARPGMFLPLLEASRQDDGSNLIGTTVDVFTSDSRRLQYRIFLVRPHATDQTLASGLANDEQRLVLQTSEGPSGTVPKLHVAARYVGTLAAGASDGEITAHPRACYADATSSPIGRRELLVTGFLVVGLAVFGLVAARIRRRVRSRPRRDHA